ncbi:MAG: hypothetical protein RLY86_2486 [Pseudomonadota bacterium]|jgi:glycosyltransferase involved in cell wall biosynthesis
MLTSRAMADRMPPDSPMGGPIPVSVIVMTRDEGENLARCLDSLTPFAEVVVVDSASRDATIPIALSRRVRVVPFIWNGRYPKKKQWSLDLPDLAHDWILFVDADERVPPDLAAEIAVLFSRDASATPGGEDGVQGRGRPPCAAYHLESRPVLMGRVLRFGGTYRKIALMDRRRCRFPPMDDLGVATMWEVEGHYQPRVMGPVGRLSSTLLHEDMKPPFAWFERHNRYSDWEVHMDRGGRRTPLYGAETPGRRLAKRVFARLPCRPLVVFIATYLLRLGILDGMPGLHHALMRSFYYWQVSLKRAWVEAEAARDRALLPPDRVGELTPDLTPDLTLDARSGRG